MRSSARSSTAWPSPFALAATGTILSAFDDLGCATSLDTLREMMEQDADTVRQQIGGAEGPSSSSD